MQGKVFLSIDTATGKQQCLKKKCYLLYIHRIYRTNEQNSPS